MGTGFLQSKRTYRGLDPLLGREEEDTVGKEVDDSLTSSSSSAVVVATTTHIVAATKSKASILEEGRGGIASGYTYMGDVRR